MPGRIEFDYATKPQPAYRTRQAGPMRILILGDFSGRANRGLVAQGPLVAALDSGLGDQMRALLHHRAFQELEAAWRSVHALVTGLETGEDIEVYLLDVTKQELAADIGAAGDNLSSSGLYGSLVEHSVHTPGGRPWSVLLGNYTFGPGPDDLAVLERMGRLASEAGGPFLAAADPAILGCHSLTANPDPRSWRPAQADVARWRALRQSASACWLGLVLPRLLLRLSYGKTGEVIERFEFEELDAKDDHEAFLWGNGAFGCARLIAQAFQDRGSSMEPSDHLDLDDLPAFVYEGDNERKLKPGAEALLSERAGTEMLDRGLMPLLSYRDRNAVRLMRFQSVAEPARGLAVPRN